ncbi:FlxA-like family protein [Pseudoduganella sp. UC29_71]|uniref:FlxA-like family protein n=1 Tax=Pseudoduganella sp. UC29_71 TaxID=3350174 RepID=UPI00366C8E63
MGSNRTGSSMDSPARIAMLQSQIKGLLKKIQALRKALMEATDPAQRMQIMKEIIDLQEQVRQAQAQIAELQIRAKRQAPPREPQPEPEDKDRWEDAYGP